MIFYARFVLHVFVNAQSKVSFITFAEGMGRIVAIPFFNLGTKLGWAVSDTPRPIDSLRRASLSIVKESGGLRCRSAWAKKMWPFSGFCLRTFQPLVSQYTDCAFSAAFHVIVGTEI